LESQVHEGGKWQGGIKMKKNPRSGHNVGAKVSGYRDSFEGKEETCVIKGG